MRKNIFGIFVASLLWANTAGADDVPFTGQVLAKSSSAWDGSALPQYPQGIPEISVLKISIAPGAQLPVHRHPVMNAAYLLRGELTVITEENRKLHLKAGEAVIEVVNKWHYGKNEGSEPAEILVFYAGAVKTPITINQE